MAPTESQTARWPEISTTGTDRPLHCRLRLLRERAKDLVVVAVETLSELPTLAEAAFIRLLPAVKSQVAGMLLPLVGEESIQLAGLSCVVAEYLAEKAKQKWEKKKTNLVCMADYARSLGNYALSLSIAGRKNSALEHSNDVVSLFQHLYKEDRNNYEADYARALNNYATELNAAGQHKESLEYASNSLKIRRRLSQKSPDRHEPDYAMSLMNYAGLLNNAGQNDEVL